MRVNRAHIVRKVEELINVYSLSYPINLIEFCNFLDIKIHDKHSIKRDGYFVRNSKRKVIFIDKRMTNIGRKNFVIAHELGHYFLHSDEIIQMCDNINDIFNKHDIVTNTEAEANDFASELLLPSRLLTEELTNDPLNFEIIKNLAEKYTTSVTFMAIKCVENSKTEDEILICYDNKVLKWWTSADDEIKFDDIPERCPTDSLIDKIYDNRLEELTTQISSRGIWDLLSGNIYEDVFSVSDNIKLTIINGKRNTDSNC